MYLARKTILDYFKRTRVSDRFGSRKYPQEVEKKVREYLQSWDLGISDRVFEKYLATGLDISFEKAFNSRYPDAYERLLMDVVRGNATLFMRRDEVEAAWGWVQPLLQSWEDKPEAPRPYAAGSWGPTAGIALIERDGSTWYE